MKKKSLTGELLPGGSIRPYQRKSDRIELYDNSALTGFSQPENQPKLSGGKIDRVIRMDLQTVYWLAALGMSRKMVAYYYGTKESKFKEACEELPDIEEAYCMGLAAGVAKAGMALNKQIEGGNMVSTIFKLKAVGGWIEEDKKKENQSEAPAVQIFIPENGRDNLEDNQEI